MFDEVRERLLDEARKSPHLLSDVAGLEEYIAESYDSRSFVELLQNADDADAKRFVVRKDGCFLIVANDGRCFTKSDFESLCRSAMSTKRRGETIGYRGIGFKSCVRLGRTIHLISEGLEATFSRELTKREIPQAGRVPLVRIPHPLDRAVRSRLHSSLEGLAHQGLATAFVFEDLLGTVVENEFSGLDPSSLLFLRNVNLVELRADVESTIQVRRTRIAPETSSIDLIADEGTSSWLLFERAGACIAFQHECEQIVRLQERDAVVHAFLPTHEPTGLGIKIHGDFSTEPSRTRVVLDDRTYSCLRGISQLIIGVLERCLRSDLSFGSRGLVQALLPQSDPRVLALQRQCFRTALLEFIKRAATTKFADIRCRPDWLNSADYVKLCTSSGIRGVSAALVDVEGLDGFLRFLGAIDLTFDEVRSALLGVTLSRLGGAEMVAYLIKNHDIKQLDLASVDSAWKIWPVKGKLVSITEALAKSQPFDLDFVDLLSERGAGRPGLRRLLVGLVGEESALRLLPDEPNEIGMIGKRSVASASTQSNPNEKPRLPVHLSLKRWRSAEQQIAQVLTAIGWKVQDVSRQNIGYDIQGLSPKGDDYYFEVKSINHPGQPFTMTSNEEAVAREKQDSYVLTLVRQDNDSLEVQFIRNPIAQLELVRQCRQWVWECTNYPYRPRRFRFES